MAEADPGVHLSKHPAGGQPDGIRVPERPELAVPPRPRLQLLGTRFALLPSLWAWPLVLSILMVGGVMLWLHAREAADREAQRADLISDALSLEAQISARLDDETAILRRLADVIQAKSLSHDDFARHTLVLDGLRRFWVSVTWLGEDGRIQAHVPEDAPPVHDASRNTGDDAGLAGHLAVGLAGHEDKPAGMLVARYSAGALLRQKMPWWLASKYDIRLVDESDNIVAATVDGPRHPAQAWYRVSMSPSLPNAWLELASRDRITPWWRSMPMALMGGFVALLAVASVMLRRQMHSVSRAEESWRTEAAWRSAMEDSLAVGIRARDLQGRLVYVNKTMADMVGWQPEELIGLMPPMPYWVPNELEQSMSRHLRNMAGHAPRDGYESRWQHRNGSVVDVMIFEAPLVDARGRQIGWMASVLNITERKHMEERERRQMEAMAHHARLTMLGEVASTLAHELNQPLSAIASYNAGVINALSQHDGHPDKQIDEPIMTALRRMGEQAAHAGRIVSRIRAFLTRREPQREPCQIKDVIESGVALLRRDMTRHGVRFELRCDNTLPDVVADPVLIEQVVVNLVRNACDALAAHEVQPGRERLVRVTASQAGGFVRVAVVDNGPGLGGHSSERLFAPFYSTKAEGMGMGLAICRSIIELHYGVLDAADVEGGGAVFTFSLPAHVAGSNLNDGQEEAD